MLHWLTGRPLWAVLPAALALLLTLGLTASVQAVDVPGGPTLTGAEVDGDALDMEFSAKLDTSSVPAAGDFEVAVDGEQRAVAHARVPNRHFVRLTLAERVVEGETVTVSYTPGEQPLRARDSAEVEGFSAQAARNLTSSPAWRQAQAQRASDTWIVVATFDGALDAESVPSPADFSITVNGSPRQPTTVKVWLRSRPRVRSVHTDTEGRRIATVTRWLRSDVGVRMAGPHVVPGDVITMAYTRGETPLRDVDGNEMASFGPKPVVNTYDPARLIYADVDGTVLLMRFDQFITHSKLPAPADFTVTVDGVHRPLERVHSPGGVTATYLVLLLSSPVAAGEEVALAYTKGSTPLREEHGDEVESFGPLPVTNVGGAPEFSRADVDGRLVSVWLHPEPEAPTYPDSSDFVVEVDGVERSVTSVWITTSFYTHTRIVYLSLSEPVDSDDVVTVAYAPGTIPLRHEGGDLAQGFEPMPVANVTVPTSPALLPELHPVRTLITVSGSVGDLRRALMEACPLGARVAATVDGEFVPFIPRWHGRIENRAFGEAFRDGLDLEPLLVEDCRKL